MRPRILSAAVLLALSPLAAHASCGSAFCPVNTQWDVQSLVQTPGWRFDLRYEYLDQDQPRHGSDAIDVGEIRSDHDEVETVNRNTFLDLNYSFDARWGVSVSLPHVDREHEHIHHHHGEDLVERWSLTGTGDARVVGQYRLESAPVSLLFGVKLPTGSTDDANGEGEIAERSLQPGTGTTDAILGVAWRHAVRGSTLSWFAQAQVQHALDRHDGFEAGDQWRVDGGLRFSATPKVNLLLQANYVVKRRDRGDEAEPEDSGGEFLYLTPGVSASLTRHVQGYLFLQQPLHQRVNGVQLTADRGVTAGFSVRF